MTQQILCTKLFTVLQRKRQEGHQNYFINPKITFKQASLQAISEIKQLLLPLIKIKKLKTTSKVSYDQFNMEKERLTDLSP